MRRLKRYHLQAMTIAASGGSSFNPTSSVYFFDDFQCNPQAASYVGCLSWSIAGTGTPAAAQYTGSGNYYGARKCTSSAAASDWCGFNVPSFIGSAASNYATSMAIYRSN